MARILWMSDSPSLATGCGLVTGEVCRRLAARGHEVQVLGWWIGKPVSCFGLEVQPCPVDPRLAAAAVLRHARHFRPHFLVSLGDVPWVGYLAADSVRNALDRLGIRWCIHYPVDGTLPNGRLPDAWVRILVRADVAITMSEFGAAASAACGIPAMTIPHGCDTDLFCPPRDKEAAKRSLGYDGRFVILSDVRNHRRKMIPRALDIVRQLRVPAGKLVFHLHTGATGQEDLDSYRYDLRADLALLGIDFAHGIQDRLDPAGVPLHKLATIYAAADVHLLTSFGEGFGLPTLQAASAGVVPVVAGNSASTELVGSHGYAVRCDASTTDEFGLVRAFIDRRRAAAVLQSLHDNPERLAERSVASRRFALGFGWDRVVDRWDALFVGKTKTMRNDAASDTGNRTAKGASRGTDSFGTVRRNRSRARPTGHDVSVLPLPRIGIPARLELARLPPLVESPSTPLVIAEATCAADVRELESLFPGVQVLSIDAACFPSPHRLETLIDRATLVVDSAGRWPGADLQCALRGTNYLGKSRLWPPVQEKSLLLDARLLLTDFALSQRRLGVARRCASRAHAAVELADTPQPRLSVAQR